MGDSGLATRHSVGPPRPEGLDEGARLRALIDEHFDFVWRTLRRLGVPPSDLDDATQQVFLVVTRKLSLIDIDRERPFVFQTALRVAADARRTVRRRREVLDSTLFERVDGAPGPDDVADRKRARAVLDAVLEDMPLDLRVVFILFEVEELSSIEIGRLLGVPTGTVASRLRRARADFQARVRRLEELADKRGESR
jgi:RNA polymerase sigma-70 factor (ECF subfamily)